MSEIIDRLMDNLIFIYLTFQVLWEINCLHGQDWVIETLLQYRAMK